MSAVLAALLDGEQEIALLDLDAMKTFERSQFVEHQNIRRVQAAKALESSVEKVLRETSDEAFVQQTCQVFHLDH